MRNILFVVISIANYANAYIILHFGFLLSIIAI